MVLMVFMILWFLVFFVIFVMQKNTAIDVYNQQFCAVLSTRQRKLEDGMCSDRIPSCP